MESPGGTEALRAAAADWSLAGDKQLLGLLQNIHQKIMSRCEETSGRLGQMVAALDSASVSLQNVNNRFMALSNSQFVESRVFDDDADIATDPPSAPARAKEVRPPSPYRSPFELGISTIERLHTPTDILRDTDSSSDDDAVPPTILIPKSVYADRPLPYIIGSYNWNNKRHVGLVSTSESGSDTESDSTRGVRTPAPSGDLSGELSGSELEARLEEHNAVQRTISSHSLARGPTDVARASRQDELSPRASQRAVAAALASRLGDLPVKDTKSISSSEEEVLPIARHLYKSSKPTSVNVFPDEPPPLHDYNYSDDERKSNTDDDDIFAEINKTAPYDERQKSDKNEDFFDDRSFTGRKVEIGNSYVFDNILVAPIDAPKPKEPSVSSDDEKPDMLKHNSRVIENKDDVSENNTKWIKKPLGAVSLFGTNQTAHSIGEAIMNRNKRSPCSSRSSDDETAKKDNSSFYEILPKKTTEVPKQKSIFDEIFTKCKKSPKPTTSPMKPTIPSTKPTKLPEKILNREFNRIIDKHHNLFNDSIFDDADIFSTNKSEIVTANVVDTSTSILDDVDVLSTRKPEVTSKSTTHTNTTTNTSLFDDVDNNTLSTKKPKDTHTDNKTRNSLSDDADNGTFSTNKPKDIPKSVIIINTSPFGDIDSRKNSTNIPKEKPKSVKTSNSTLFADVDNKTLSSNKPKNTPEIAKTTNTPLFDDVDHKTFPTNKPKDTSKSVRTTNTTLVNDIDNKTVSTNKPKHIPKSVKTINRSIFTDDDNKIFSTNKFKDSHKSVISTKTSLFDDVDNNFKPDHAHKSVITSKTSLFDDVDDDIFSANKSTVHINRVITTNTSLFDDVDDLFADISVNKIDVNKEKEELKTRTGNDEIRAKLSIEDSASKIETVLDNNHNSFSNKRKESLKKEKSLININKSVNDFVSDLHSANQKKLERIANNDLFDDDLLSAKQIKTEKRASIDLYGDELVSDQQKEPKVIAFYDHDDDDLFANIRLPNLNVLQSNSIAEKEKRKIQIFNIEGMKLNVNEIEKGKKMLQNKETVKSQLFIEKPSSTLDSSNEIVIEKKTHQNELKDKTERTLSHSDDEVDNWHLVKEKTESLRKDTKPPKKDTKPFDWIHADKTIDENNSVISKVLKINASEKIIENSLPSTEKQVLISKLIDKNSSILDSDDEIDNSSHEKENKRSLKINTELPKKDDKPIAYKEDIKIEQSKNSKLPKSKIAITPVHNNNDESSVPETLHTKSFDIFDPDYEDEEREKMHGIKNIESFEPVDAYDKMITSNQIVNRSNHHETPKEITKMNEAIILFNETFSNQPPAFEKPKEKKKSININALFDDDSEDEAVFLRKPEIFDDKPVTNTIATKPLYPIFADEPPAIETENKANNVKLIEQSISAENLSGSVVENLDDSTNSKQKTVGKLKPVNFNINVRSLLPGTLPKKVTKNETSPPKSPEIPKDLKKHSQVVVKSVSFDSDPDSTVLDNKISKERVKIQVKRRPSTRRARIEAARKSKIEVTEDVRVDYSTENDLLQHGITADISDKFTQESEGLKETDQNMEMLHDMISVIEKFDKIVTDEPVIGDVTGGQGVVKKYNIADIAREDGETTQILNINDDDVYVLKNTKNTKIEKPLFEDKIDNEEMKEETDINTVQNVYGRTRNTTQKLSSLIDDKSTSQEMKEEEREIKTLEKDYDNKEDISTKKLNIVDDYQKNIISITKKNTLDEDAKKITTSTILVPDNSKSILPAEITDEIFIPVINEDKRTEKRSADLDEIVYEFDKTSSEIEKYDKQTYVDDESEKRNTTTTKPKIINVVGNDTKISSLKTVEVTNQFVNNENIFSKTPQKTVHSSLNTVEVTETSVNEDAEDPDSDELENTSAEIEKYGKKSDINHEIFEDESTEVDDTTIFTENTTKFVSEAAFSPRAPQVKDTGKSISKTVEHTKEPVAKLSVVPKPPTKTLFGDLSDDDEDLFKSKKIKPKETNVTNVFSNDSDDDGLFVQKLIVKKNQHQKTDNQTVTKKPLFDDDSSDDMFSNKAKNSAEYKKTRQRIRRPHSKDRIFLPKKLVETELTDPLSLFGSYQED